MIRKSLPLLLLAPFAVVIACKGAPEIKPAGPVPTIANQDLVVSQELTDYKLTLNGKVASAVAARIEKASYELVVEGKVVKTGEAMLNLDVPAGGTADFSISDGAKYVASAEELKAYSEKGGTLLAALRGKLHAKSGGQSQVLEFARSKEIRVPRIPKMNLTGAEGARFGPEEVSVTLYLGVENPNNFALNINGLHYTAFLAGKQMQEGKLGGGDKVTGSSTGVFEIQIPFSKETYGPDVKAKLKDNLLGYEVKGSLKGELFDVPYEFKGEMKLNVSK